MAQADPVLSLTLKRTTGSPDCKICNLKSPCHENRVSGISWLREGWRSVSNLCFMLVELLHFTPGVVSVLGREVRGQGERNERSNRKARSPRLPSGAGSRVWAWRTQGPETQTEAMETSFCLLPAHMAAGFPTAR